MQASEGVTLAVELVLEAAAYVDRQLTASEVSPVACEDTAVSAWKGVAACRRIAASELQQPLHRLTGMHVAAVATAAVAVKVELVVAAVVGSHLRLLLPPMGHNCWIPGPTQPARFQ